MVELDEYVVANRIYQEPAFAWWIPFTLCKQNMIVSKLKKKNWCTTNKLRIEVTLQKNELTISTMRQELICGGSPLLSKC